ncbi:MAG: sodium:proton antiporter [Bacteroidetes bacterium]|nr:MAG: sodium:proton antiporter [Bacteroidota bacterium]PTM14612.1 MAG: sodium:proton antiporter [Bacteroidota bacterium]
MLLLIVAIFVIGYLGIAFEHPLKVDKAAFAILTGVVCWVLLGLGQEVILPATEGEFINEALLHHVGEIAEILFFLLGAMTIVELVDSHDGFSVITDHIATANRVRLLWLVCIVTFFFSAILDNMTTAIVMAALLKKLLADQEDRWFFAGMVVIAANAGGAWSPIGDVTTIMLWIGGQVTAANIVVKVFLPGLACLLAPLLLVSLFLKGELKRPKEMPHSATSNEGASSFEQQLILGLGVGGLLFVPLFKSITHLPPFMGMLFSLGVLWVITEMLHRNKTRDHRHGLSVAGVIRRIDTPSVLFFLGILLAVASLQTAGLLGQFALALDQTFGNIYTINILIGLLSSVVDNVPLVAGAMGMYTLDVYPQDHTFWELLAYCAGTGGSVLIIGSAAGVAIMGILKIDFLWYLKKISWLALVGYFSGVGIYYLLNGAG